VLTKLLTNNADSETLEDAWLAINDADKPDWYPEANVKFAHALTRYLLRDGDKCLASFKAVINNP